MPRISAAENLLIEFSSQVWRLVSTLDGTPKALLQATSDDSELYYSPRFGTTRRLPTTGKLDYSQIAQVVIGWSPDDEAWHLGVVLTADLAESRGTRWCALAHWPDPDIHIFEGEAVKAGSGLASVVNAPFYHAPAKPKEAPKAVPLPDLPLQFGIWSMDENVEGVLELRRDSSWARQKVMRIGWYSLWLAIYLVVSVLTITSDIALPNAGTLIPNPQWLPYLGLVVGILLVGLILQQIYHLRTQPDNYVVDPQRNQITARWGNGVRWSMTDVQVQSVYASEVIKKKELPLTVQHGEINLHLGGGKFRHMLEQDDEIVVKSADAVAAMQSEILPLERQSVVTDLQRAVVHIAHAMGEIPAWYDARVK